MFNSAFKIATVWGIPIKLHGSLLLLFLFFLFTARVNTVGQLLLVLTFMALLFASIAAHELGHSYVAIRKGCRVREITLLFMGGAAQMEQIPARPRDEIQMALAGPAVSLVLSLTAWATLLVIPARTLAGALLSFIGILNLTLTIFNLLPAFPMDGGRVLRAILTPRLGRLKATYIASRVGRMLAVGLIIVGIFGIPGLSFFRARNPLMIVIGFMVFSLAGREYKRVRLEELLRSGTAAWPFAPYPGTAPPPQLSLDDEVIVGPPPYARRDEEGDGNR